MADEAAAGTLGAAQRVADALRDDITEGRLLPGGPLREVQQAARLGASRNTVREAFRLLAHEGLVEHTPHRGVAVRRLTEADVADIYRIRAALELLGIEALAGDADRLSALAAVVRGAETAAARGDWSSVATADLRFHQAVVAAVGSERIDAMFRRLLAELRLVFGAMPDAARFHGPYLRRNRRLVDLLTAGEVAGALDELRAYLSDAQREITGVLRIRDAARAP